jgi:hypothetical protein
MGHPWHADGAVLLDGSPVCRTAARGQTGIAIGLDLGIRDLDGIGLARDADPAGLPALEDAESWPLELEV